MADVKITALAPIAGASVADADPFPMVDISDTSMAASGTTKKVTASDLGVIVGADGRLLLNSSTPAAPASGVKIYGKTLGRIRPAAIGPNGKGLSLAHHRSEVQVASMVPAGNGTVVTTSGITAITAYYGPQTSSWAAADKHGRMARIAYPAYPWFNYPGGWREATAKYSLTDGFFFSVTFGFDALSTASRIFYGFSTTSGALANADPSALLNLFGLFKDSGDTNLRIGSNDGSGAVTSVDTGIPPALSSVYRFTMYDAPGTVNVECTLERIDPTPTSFSTALTTNMPSATSALAIQLFCNVGNVGQAMTPTFMNFMTEVEI